MFVGGSIFLAFFLTASLLLDVTNKVIFSRFLPSRGRRIFFTHQMYV